MSSLTACGKISARLGSTVRKADCTNFVTLPWRQRTAHRDGEKGKILLRQRPVKFHVVTLVEPHGTHIADHADDLDRHAPARDE
jgi:hypothetical protein